MMKNSLRWILAVMGSLVVTSGLSAASILYWTDHAVGDDAMAGALAGIGDHGDFQVTLANGDGDFANRIATGEYDLGILFVQLDASGYESIGALGSFAADGGWAMYADFSGDNDNAALFGFQFTGNVNQNQVTITDPVLTNPMALDSSVSLASPGWIEYSFGLSIVEGQGTILASFENGDAAVVRTFSGGRVIGFGMLNDTFANHEEGVAFFTNSIVAIPEPSTYAGILGAIGIVAAFGGRRFRAKARI